MTGGTLESIRDELRRARAADRVHSSYLLDGPAGTGCEETAFWFARLLLCRSDGPEPCERCPDCRRSRPHAESEGRRYPHPDLLQVEPDGPFIKIAAVRELQRDLALSANEGGWRLAVILAADRLRNEAANALLKTLEEPRPRTCLLLVAERAEALPRTLRSRSARLRFAPRPETEIREALREEGLEAEDAWLAAALCGGSSRLAHEWAERSLQEARELCHALAEAASGGASQVLDFAERFRGGSAVRARVELFLAVHAAVVRRRADEALSSGDPEHAARWVSQFERGELARRELVRRNLNPQMLVEEVLMEFRRAASPAG